MKSERHPLGALALTVVLGVCAPACRQKAQLPLGALPKALAGPRVALPDGGMAHTEPLATATWSGNRLRACGGRRLETRGGEARTTPGACIEAGPDAPSLDGGAPPAAQFIAGEGEPAPPCRVLYEDIPGDPGAPPARARLLGPAGRALLDEWKPPLDVDGDYFAVEASWSPDGRWLGIVHTSVGLGEGERLVRVVAATVRPAPACR